MSSSRRGRRATPYYLACPTIVQDAMDRFAAQTGRGYHLFDYVGAPDADARDYPDGLGRGRGGGDDRAPERAGREARPAEGAPLPAVCRRRFPGRAAATVRSIAVLDRTKEPGALGEPLYQDVVTGFSEAFSSGTAPASRSSRASSADAMACRRRNSRRPWPRACSTS